MSSDPKKAPTAGDATKKITREEKLRAAKQDESVEKVIRSLGKDPPEVKLLLLAKNYLELERENNRLTTSAKSTERLFLALTREKENILREYNKGVLIKDKLEQVCREQQKLIKSVKSESMEKIREEEEKRKETQANLQQSINEIFVTLKQNNEENEKLKDVNVNVTKKLKYLTEQYGIREKQLEQINQQVKLESQLNDAKMAKVQMEANMEKEKVLRQSEITLQELLKCKKNLNDMTKRESELKSQLALYTEKYDMFQSSLQKSNSLFTDYKTEINKISKTNRTLEKECTDFKRKYEKSHAALLNLATDKHQQDQEIARSARQLTQLQKLCRTLQAERGSLLDVLKQHDIERPPMPEMPVEPVVPEPVIPDPIAVKTAKIDELKGFLAQIQGQMNELTATKKEEGKTNNKKNKKKQGKSGGQQSTEKEAIQEKSASKESTPPVEENIVKEQQTSEEKPNKSTEEQSVVDENIVAEQTVEKVEAVQAATAIEEKSVDAKTVANDVEVIAELVVNKDNATADAPAKGNSIDSNATNNQPTVSTNVEGKQQEINGENKAKNADLTKIIKDFLDVLSCPVKQGNSLDTLEEESIEEKLLSDEVLVEPTAETNCVAGAESTQ